MMKAGDNGVIEINTAPLDGKRVVALAYKDIDDFLMANEEETDISDAVTIVDDDDDDLPYMEKNFVKVQVMRSDDLFVENCITCEHSETEEEGNNIILPSGCRKGVPVKANMPIWCSKFTQL